MILFTLNNPAIQEGIAIRFSSFNGNFCVAENDNFHLIFRVRFDNKSELNKKLGNQFSTDAELILHSYTKWGKDCVNHFLGDWSFGIWDKGTKELFLARDHFGSTNIFYYHTNSFFVFAWKLEEIINLEEVIIELNTNAIVQLSSFFKRDAQTFYKNIYQIPCAHTLLVKEDKSYLNNYWLPINCKSIIYAKEEDYTNHFLELFNESISCRLSGSSKVGIALSSGLDSGSTAIIAAQQFNETGRKIEAFTWRPTVVHKETKYLTSHFDELNLVKKLIAPYPEINLNIVNAKSNNFLKNLYKTLAIHQQPEPPFIHYFEIFEEAQEKGVDTILTGDWGNHTISYSGNISIYFKEILSKSKSRSLKEVYLSAKGNSYSWRSQLDMSLLKVILKEKIRFNKIKDRTRDYLNPASIQNELSLYNGATPEIEILRKKSQYPLNNLLNMIQSGAIGRQATFGEGFGLHVQIPVIDKRLVEFCLGIPMSQFINKENNRLLIKRAMEGKIHNDVLHNKIRGVQGGDLPLKCMAEAKEINDILKEFRKSPITDYWLNLDLMEQNLNEIVHSEKKPVKQIFHKVSSIQKGVMLGLFLKRFE